MTRRLLLLGSLAVVGTALLADGVLGLYALAQDDQHRSPWLFWLLALFATAGLGALGWTACMVRGHFRRLEELRTALFSLGHQDVRVVPTLGFGPSDVELIRFKGALQDLAATFRDLSDRPDERLAAVLAAVREPIVVITDEGLVSLVNASAKALLGPEQVALGTSVFAALKRHRIADALAASTAQGAAVEAQLETVDGEIKSAWVVALGDLGGGVISLPRPAEPPEAVQEVEHDLTLHDRPPTVPAPGPDTPLEDLPALAFDCETTGLDVKSDRIVSIGAVRLHGARIFRTHILDVLVNPACPIPRRSTAVHGITDEMVQGAPGFERVFPLFCELQGETALIGHNIPFDITMVQRECTVAGLNWQPPAFIDVFPLTIALEPGLPGYSLDALADWLGVEIRGRHTALGDTLVTAEVYQRLLPRLAAAGVTTLGDAQALMGRAKDVIKQQDALGWTRS